MTITTPPTTTVNPLGEQQADEVLGALRHVVPCRVAELGLIREDGLPAWGGRLRAGGVHGSPVPACSSACALPHAVRALHHQAATHPVIRPTHTTSTTPLTTAATAPGCAGSSSRQTGSGRSGGNRPSRQLPTRQTRDTPGVHIAGRSEDLVRGRSTGGTGRWLIPWAFTNVHERPCLGMHAACCQS